MRANVRLTIFASVGMVAPMNLRQSEILELARTAGRVSVEELAGRFGVTRQTIRRDLAELADGGRLDRVHGGAVLRSGVTNIGYAERAGIAAEAKRAIGRACAAGIADNTSLILNIGTTTEAVARALLGHRNLTVVTNNLNIANILAANDSCDIIVAGGLLRRSDGGLTGALTTEVIGNFKADLAIIGCSAIDADGDLLDYDMAEVRVSRAILRQARQKWLVTDASKLERTAPIRVVSVTDLDAVFIDKALPPRMAEVCAVAGTRVVVAG